MKIEILVHYFQCLDCEQDIQVTFPPELYLDESEVKVSTENGDRLGYFFPKKGVGKDDLPKQAATLQDLLILVKRLVEYWNATGCFPEIPPVQEAGHNK